MKDNLERFITHFLGPTFAGRRFLRYRELENLGLVANRATLRLWIEAGVFPPPLKLAGPSGRSTLWAVAEVAAAIAERVGERDGGGAHA